MILMSVNGIEALDVDLGGGLGASRFLRLGCLSALWLVLGLSFGVFCTGDFAEEGRLKVKADFSITPRINSFELFAGGEGGIKLGGGAFNPAILPSDISFRRLQKSSLISFVLAASTF